MGESLHVKIKTIANRSWTHIDIIGKVTNDLALWKIQHVIYLLHSETTTALFMISFLVSFVICSTQDRLVADLVMTHLFMEGHQ